jgi:hypothetical protein
MLRDSLGSKCNIEEQPRIRNNNGNERYLMLYRRFMFEVGNFKFVTLQKYYLHGFLAETDGYHNLGARFLITAGPA